MRPHSLGTASLLGIALLSAAVPAYAHAPDLDKITVQ